MNEVNAQSDTLQQNFLSRLFVNFLGHFWGQYGLVSDSGLFWSRGRVGRGGVSCQSSSRGNFLLIEMLVAIENRYHVAEEIFCCAS